jgi:hypothetical protein
MFLFYGCKQGPELNARFKSEYGGVCDACPAIRLDTLIQKFHEGILTVIVDSAKKTIEIGYDSTLVKVTDLIFYLNSYGYDIGDDIAIEVLYLDSCCRQNAQNELLTQPFGGLPGDTTFSIEELEDFSTDFLEGRDSAGLGLDLEEELNLDQKFSKELEQSLKGNLSLDSLDLDIDINLD